MAPYRFLHVHMLNGVAVVRFAESWLTTDLARGQLARELLALVTQENCSKLLLSLDGVTYASSTMLGELIKLNKRLHAKGGKLTLCDLTPTVQELADLVKLKDIIDIRNTESEGLTSFG